MRVKDIPKELPGMLINAYVEARRILRLTRKPRTSEFRETAKITGLGIVVIGLLGFIIFVISQVLTK